MEGEAWGVHMKITGGCGTQEHMWHGNDPVREAASVGVKGDESWARSPGGACQQLGLGVWVHGEYSAVQKGTWM